MEKSKNEEQQPRRKSLAEISALPDDPRIHSTGQSVRFVFSPEDMKKMEGMTSMEKADYKDYLITEGKYKKIIIDKSPKNEKERNKE